MPITRTLILLLALCSLSPAKDPEKQKPHLYAALVAFKDTDSGYYILGCVDKDGKYAVVSVSPYLVNKIKGATSVSEGIYEFKEETQ